MTLYTVSEFSRLVGLAPQTVRNLISSGRLVPEVVGKTGTGNGHRLSSHQAEALKSLRITKRTLRRVVL